MNGVDLNACPATGGLAEHAWYVHTPDGGHTFLERCSRCGATRERIRRPALPVPTLGRLILTAPIVGLMSAFRVPGHVEVRAFWRMAARVWTLDRRVKRERRKGTLDRGSRLP